MTALSGLRVVELANERIAFAGKLMADMGADLILAEPTVSRQQTGSGPQPLLVALPQQQTCHHPGPRRPRRCRDFSKAHRNNRCTDRSRTARSALEIAARLPHLVRNQTRSYPHRGNDPRSKRSTE